MVAKQDPDRIAELVELSAELAWPPLRLWLARLDATPDAARLACLSEAERQRAARFVFERDRRRYLAAHCLLREVLAEQCDQAPQALQFRQGIHGKPSLEAGHPLAFNLSHSGDLAAIVVGPDGELGVDIEIVRPMSDVLSLAQHNFTAGENQELRDTDPARRELAFLWGWTRKEACLKALGSGLSLSPVTFHAGLAPLPRTVELPGPEGPALAALRSLRCEGALLSVAWMAASGTSPPETTPAAAPPQSGPLH
ncbi:4'-phosphopantetheinyl transferase family protein [Caldimonas brevitalea]|uniref:Phosphopantetheinyl transferase n=1 Tax=Caldimonas brevitalea TaxID=413882 RepID=A0A0G3BR95_9BURK|nr:4'-phosphopantetheinyl transferase superfamily protein [Caldimonas brevitalea]AKJ29876.1 phosphopantetheinyl transferase [Caldimonas brevitalea]